MPKTPNCASISTKWLFFPTLSDSSMGTTFIHRPQNSINYTKFSHNLWKNRSHLKKREHIGFVVIYSFRCSIRLSRLFFVCDSFFRCEVSAARQRQRDSEKENSTTTWQTLNTNVYMYKGWLSHGIFGFVFRVLFVRRIRTAFFFSRVKRRPLLKTHFSHSLFFCFDCTHHSIILTHLFRI